MDRDDIHYEALRARDSRFDGKFFVGVKTTGIYCRPICPAKPQRVNVEFFPDAHAAERAGYRPCLRCRPEAAPRSPAWIGKSIVVKRAIGILPDHAGEDWDETRFAARFGVSARHLRRLFMAEIGKTPTQLVLITRLNLARKLISETALPIGEIALAAGFRSIRHFNEAFRLRFARSPREIRRRPRRGSSGISITLPYRPPFNFSALLDIYAAQGLAGLEWFTPGKMHRILEFAGKVGQITIADEPARSRLAVDIDFPDTSMIHVIISRVRTLFDLDADPTRIADRLNLHAGTRRLLKKHPGIRLPSGWDPFEVAVSAILGQGVSESRRRSCVTHLIATLGKRSAARVSNRGRVSLFPTAEVIARSDLTPLKAASARKIALREFARAIAEHRLSLDSTQDVGAFVAALSRIPGIDPKTARLVALRALRDPDAFPGRDPTLAPVRPWRGYVAALRWREHGGSPEKISKRRGSAS